MTDTLSETAESVIAEELHHLVGDTDEFFSNRWARQPVVWRAPSNIQALITEDEIWKEVDSGFLSRPYFTMFNEGVRSAMTDITRSRKVVGRELPGFIRAEQIHSDFESGGTFKLNQAEHWHGRIRRLVKGMGPHFSGGLEAFVFLSPPDKTAIQAHTDGAHVFVLQVAGQKDWVVGRLDESAISDSTLHEGEIRKDVRMEVTLRAGDILYMPHGCPHYATARDGNSIHVAITVEEPSSTDLLEVALARLIGMENSSDEVLSTPLPMRIANLRSRVLTNLTNLNSRAVLKDTIKLRQEHRL